MLYHLYYQVLQIIQHHQGHKNEVLFEQHHHNQGNEFARLYNQVLMDRSI